MTIDVQGECRAELARAMLSHSQQSRCDHQSQCKDTTSILRVSNVLPIFFNFFFCRGHSVFHSCQLFQKKDNLFSKSVNDSSKVSTCSGKRLSPTSGKEQKTVNHNQEKTVNHNQEKTKHVVILVIWSFGQNRFLVVKIRTININIYIYLIVSK